MRIGITGVTGFIGQSLAALARRHGHTVTGFSRSTHTVLPGCDTARVIQPGQPVDLSGLDAIIHLAGESVLGYWTAAKKERIIQSRRETTRALVQAIGQMRQKPGVFLCASGTGYYGDCGAKILTEDAPPGRGFLAEVAWIWEEEAAAAVKYGVRVASLRTGLVLGKNQGAFPLMKRAFSLGLGGCLGSGRQYFPWLHVDDIASLYLFCLENESMRGPVNAAAPGSCTNAEFTRTLARVLRRPAFLDAPTFVLKTLLGEQAAMLLDSQRAIPAKAQAEGFTFTHPQLEPALRNLAASYVNEWSVPPK